MTNAVAGKRLRWMLHLACGLVVLAQVSLVSGQAPRTAPRQGPAAPEAQVVAVVNGQQISRQHLGNECIRRYGEDVLESMLNKHLIWQECKQRGVVITQGDVDAEIESMAAKFGLQVDRWLSLLERERDIAPDKYKRDIIWPTLALRKLAAGEIEVTEQELKEAFESQYGPKVKVRMILCDSRQDAESVHAKAVAEPNRFGDFAKTFSKDKMSAPARGLIEPIRKHSGPADLERIAFGLKEGQISPIIPFVNQFIILKCEGHMGANYVTGDQVERVKAQLHDQIRDKKLRVTAGTLFQRLQKSANVVNGLKDPQLRQQQPGVAATINGQPITMRQLADECIGRHGRDVLEGEVNRAILDQELRKTRKVVTNEAIDQEIARAAEAYGYITPQGGPDVDAWLKSVTESDKVSLELYVHDAVWPSVALKLLVGDAVQVTQEDLDKGFIANYGQRVEALTIVLSNQRTANTVWDMARNNNTDEFFGELAQQYSIEPVSKANFGRIPPIRRYGGQPVIEEEAFKLQPGELSGIISIGDKFVILRCIGRTKPVVEDFAAVEPELRRDIQEKKLRVAMAEKFDRLKEAAQIDDFLSGSSQMGQANDRIAQPPTRARQSIR